MKRLQGQELNSLVRPLLIGGLCGGIGLGMLSAMLLFLPELLWLPEGGFLAVLLGFFEIVFLTLGVSGLLGFLASLAPIAGALLALRLSFQRGPFPAAGQQIGLAGLGGFVGGIVSAFALGTFLFGDDISLVSVGMMSGIVLASALCAMAMVYFIMRRREPRRSASSPAGA